MAKIVMLVFCTLFSSMVMAEQSRQECWLDNLPGTKNDFVAQRILVDCSTYALYDGKKIDGWFGGKTASWCVKKYGEDTVSELAARIITAACFRLYENK